MLFKKSIIISLMLLSVTSLYFSAYLPFAKARSYIFFSNSLNNVKTLPQFKESVKEVFDFYSPIGQEEAVRFTSHEILKAIRNPEQQEAVQRELVNLMEPYALRTNVRHLLSMGEAYSILWSRYKQEEDFKKSEEYLRSALERGPDLPPVLYPLFELYGLHGDKERAKEIGERILRNWPDAENVKSAIEGL